MKGKVLESCKEVLKIADLDEFMQDKSLEYFLKEGATNGLDKKTEEILIDRLDDYLRVHHIKLICISHNDAIKKICNKQLRLGL